MCACCSNLYTYFSGMFFFMLQLPLLLHFPVTHGSHMLKNVFFCFLFLLNHLESNLLWFCILSVVVNVYVLCDASILDCIEFACQTRVYELLLKEMSKVKFYRRVDDLVGWSHFFVVVNYIDILVFLFIRTIPFVIYDFFFICKEGVI